MVTLFGILFAVAGLLLIFLERKLIRLSLSSYRWRKTEATVVDSEDDSFTAPGYSRWTGVDEVTCSETKHIYEYEVDGKTYQTSNYCFGAQTDQAGAAFLIGTKVPIFYDPKDPKRAVVMRGLQLSLFFGPVLLLTSCVFFVFSFLK